MAANVTMPTIDATTLVNYYYAKLPLSSAQVSAAAQARRGGAAAQEVPPWDSSIKQPAPAQADSDALAVSPFIDLSKAKAVNTNTADGKQQADVEKLFALYQGLNRLAYLASMAGRDGTLSGQLTGLNSRFQTGLGQVTDFLNSADFNNLIVLAGQKASSVTSIAAVPLSANNYNGGIVVKGPALFNPVPGLSASDQFTLSIAKGGTNTDVAIDLSQVSGPLTLDNVTAYINQQLSDAGFATRFKRVVVATDPPPATTTGTDTSTTTDPLKSESFGLEIDTSGSEKVTLSAAAAQPAIYLAGTTGTVADNDQQGRLVKLTGLAAGATSEFSKSIAPDNGTSTAKSTVADANGNVYVLGTTTGDFGGLLDKGTQDAMLTKYDSAGNLLWQRMLGADGSADAGSLALDPTGGVVIAGTTDSLLSQSAIGGGKDSYVAKYTADGNQSWVHQLGPVADDAAFAVTVDATGHVYVGGQVNGVIAAGQSRVGGQDAYVTKLDFKGKAVSSHQFGTTGTDQVSNIATTSDGGLVVASVENGHAMVRKYAGGDPTSAPVWQQDLGDLQNGSLGGIAVDGNDIYLSGATTNAALNAGGAASVAHASSGGTDAFVFKLTDAGSSATPDYVSYVGTASSDRGASLAVSSGQVYLTGTTRGVLPGQTQSFANTENMFVAALNADGTQNWLRQYGGVEGTSSGAGIAVDAQGSSVLDALGLPRGTITLTQSVELTSQTTVHAGDTFKLTLTPDGRSGQTRTITIDKDETMSSLATKINTVLGSAGKASVTHNANGAALKITVNPNAQLQIDSGQDGFDALKGLGITPSILVNQQADGSSKSKTSGDSSGAPKQIFGIGLTAGMELSSTKDANAARASLLSVLSAVRNAYRTVTTPAPTGTAQQASGPAPTYLTSRLANYSLALNMMASSPSSSGSSSSSTLGLF